MIVQIWRFVFRMVCYQLRRDVEFSPGVALTPANVLMYGCCVKD